MPQRVNSPAADSSAKRRNSASLLARGRTWMRMRARSVAGIWLCVTPAGSSYVSPADRWMSASGVTKPHRALEDLVALGLPRVHVRLCDEPNAFPTTSNSSISGVLSRISTCTPMAEISMR